MDLIAIFLTGLTVGGLTCLAVQGGLLASLVATREQEDHKRSEIYAVTITGVFLLAKLISYLLLGFLLGLFGELISLTDNVQAYMQLLAGLYMIIVALNLLDVHPIFRYAIIQPPKKLFKLVKNRSRSKELFAPVLLGITTIFIPCGTTLAMEALAISSANPLYGAAILGAFTLGTVPMFLGIGYITSLLGEAFKNSFYKIAAVIIIYLGLISIDGSLVALGSPINSTTLFPNKSTIVQTVALKPAQDINEIEIQEVEIKVTSNGYSPERVQVKKGIPVKVTLKAQNAYSCAAAFRVPTLGISKNLGEVETQTFTFTPDKIGIIPFNCSMGMYRGTFEVIE